MLLKTFGRSPHRCKLLLAMTGCFFCIKSIPAGILAGMLFMEYNCL